VQRAVQWGEMPLEAWLEEVINDGTVLARVRETLGLKDQETQKSE
jgi:type VI secretion system protein ImpA